MFGKSGYMAEVFLVVFILIGGAFCSSLIQSVGGDFGRSWLEALPAAENASMPPSGDLWGWGGMPKGKELVDGQLVESVHDGMVVINGSDWMGIVPRDPPLYSNNTSNNSESLSPFFLSDDPWVRAQQLGETVRTTWPY
ncbi:MAG: hypothetical protein JW986_04875 [Methanotrichaceae archaeon]|nr:hypothetical protein [Methanotrichaceae archaeon]